jgi:hypothetical protein
MFTLAKTKILSLGPISTSLKCVPGTPSTLIEYLELLPPARLIEEIVVDDMGNDFTLKFDHCLLKTEKDINESEIFINSLKNQDPLFVDYTVNDLQLDSISPARDIGKIEIANTVPTDLKGVDRLESPDIGAYECIPVIETKKR